MSKETEDGGGAVVAPVEPSVRPRAWLRVSNISGQSSGVFESQDVELRSERLVPLYEGEEMVAPLLTALRHAWTGNHKAAEAYALLAAQHLDDKGERLQARCLRETVEVLTGKRAPTFVHVA